MDWTIEFGQGCGPLRFGMSATEVERIIGPADETIPAVAAEVRNGSAWWECIYMDGKLSWISADPALLPNLYLDGNDLLTMPILSVIGVLDRTNGGTGQAQGGSLYFEGIRVALLQFENADIRKLVLFSSDYDHGELLAPVSLSDVAAYYADYAEHTGRAAENDTLRPANQT